MLWVFVSRVIILRKKPNLVQGFSAAAVFLALFLCLIPDIFNLDEPRCAGSNTSSKASGAGRVLWPLCFMFGFVSHCIRLVFLVCSITVWYLAACCYHECAWGKKSQEESPRDDWQWSNQLILLSLLDVTVSAADNCLSLLDWCDPRIWYL